MHLVLKILAKPLAGDQSSKAEPITVVLLSGQAAKLPSKSLYLCSQIDLALSLAQGRFCL